MKSIYDMLYEIDNDFDGIFFDKITGISIVGEVMSEAFKHPIQYVAETTIRDGDDDCFKGVGWSPSEAIRNLLKVLNNL